MDIQARSRRLIGALLMSAIAVVGLGAMPAGATGTPAKGYVEICKKADGPGVTGNFTFTFAGMTRTIPVGTCTAPIQVPAGSLTITEQARAGFALSAVNTIPSGRLVSANLGMRTATVTIVAGDVSTETIVIFKNKAVPGKGQLKICKVAGEGVAVGTHYTFTAGGTTYTVPAGPAPEGYCVLNGWYPVGTHVTVTETVPAGVTVVSITVAPADRLVSKTANSVTVRIGSGVTVVTFKNQKMTPPPPPKLEGCSPGFFKNHPGAYPSPYTSSTIVGTVFAGLSPSLAGLTFQQALELGGGPGVLGAEQILLRQAVAALLNAAHPSVDFGLSPAQVIAQVNAALTSDVRATILALAGRLDVLNNKGCPLS